MNAQTSKEIGAAVRSRRKELKVTQKDLALTCGTGLRFIIDLEKGKVTCQIGKVLQVLQALGLRLQITSSSAAAGNGREL
ncbi:MAG: helix-turn-helix transcriptional regulator [Candidatus Erginobacter occultus]|nr:helix-turn-helix transcriptional regulator [Candidatus Erginobacter occultus]